MVPYTDADLHQETAILNLLDRSSKATLRQTIMNIVDLANPKCHLFHAVNKMFLKVGFICWFHPTCSQPKQERHNCRTSGVFKRIMNGIIDTIKFHKFFTNTAPYHAKDTWWDPKSKCVMIRVDKEMTNILTHDKNLIFLEKKVEIDITNKLAVATTSRSSQADLTSTGLISTFCMTPTQKTCYL